MHSVQTIFALLAVLLAAALFVSALVLLGALALRKAHESRRENGGLRTSRLGGLALGSMFLGFQKIVNPQVRHAVVEELQERTDAGNDGEPTPRGGRHYHRQLRGIRRGEEVGKLRPARDSDDSPS